MVQSYRIYKESQKFRSLEAILTLKAKVTSFQNYQRPSKKQFKFEGKTFLADKFLKIFHQKFGSLKAKLTLKFKVTSFELETFS